MFLCVSSTTQTWLQVTPAPISQPYPLRSTNIRPLPMLAPQQYPWLYNYTNKIKFKRKGGWIRSFNCIYNPVKVKFGYGHPTWILVYNHPRHRYKRYLSQHCIIWITSYFTNKNISNLVIDLRPFNGYTMNGIRNSKFFLLKRKGKDSKYTHLKSKIF
jgi:hypothetical protein